jgi:hypothetical protein
LRARRLHIHKTARGRVEASIGVGLAAICAACIIPGAPALAASRSASELRRAFAQTLLAVRVTGNAAACSSTTPEGRIALIEILVGEAQYLPSTTCSEAFAGRAAEEVQGSRECGLPTPTVAEFRPVIRQAVIRVRGNGGTVQLTHDFLCEGEGQLNGSPAVTDDRMGTSHWQRSHGRWLFDDQPTGTYSAAGRKAVAMLRAALSGRTVTQEEDPPLRSLTVPFCTNGTAQLVSTLSNGETAISTPLFWYVAAGLTAAGQREPPFDAQGDPQGEVILPISFFENEWNVTLVGGTPVVTAPPDVALPVGNPGTAGC